MDKAQNLYDYLIKNLFFFYNPLKLNDKIIIHNQILNYSFLLILLLLSKKQIINIMLPLKNDIESINH